MAQIIKIDIEPQWNDIYNVMMRMCGDTSNIGKILKQCKSLFELADEIRALQKSGIKNIDISFDDNGRIVIKEND